jgi:hypothetical protein
MNIFFYEIRQSPSKIAFTISNETKQSLIKDDVIPHDAKIVVKKYSEFINKLEGKTILSHIDKVKFDDYENPKDVVLDLERIVNSLIDTYREFRFVKLAELDSLQTSALLKNKKDVIRKIEEDKEKLRSLPADMTDRFSKVKNIDELMKTIPEQLTEDYKSKYEPLIYQAGNV